MLNGLLGGGFLREERHGVSLVIEIIALLLLAWLAGRPATLTFLLGAALLHAAVLGSVGLVLVEAKLVLPVLRPLLVLSVATLLLWARRHVDAERRKAQLQGVFASYFPPALVERFVRDPSRLALDGRRAELTVLFSDIVDFTPMTADMDPGDVHLILNEYFEAMAEEVFEQDGTLDKFIGDGLMVFFGDPTPHEDHAARAVRAALGMQRRVARLNQHWEAEGRKTIRIRIGIHTGPVVVGNMGSSRRLSYTVLGAAVNLAARMESGAPAGGVLITGVTRERIGDEFTCEAVVPVVAKGFPDPIPAYVVRDAC
jgi:adenylate cyclase